MVFAWLRSNSTKVGTSFERETKNLYFNLIHLGNLQDLLIVRMNANFHHDNSAATVVGDVDHGSKEPTQVLNCAVYS